MDAKELRQVRTKLNLTQQEMARALNISFVTYNRWENGHRAIPSDAAKLLDGLQGLMDTAVTHGNNLSLDDIREAIMAAGVVGVVSNAAVANMLPTSLIVSLAAVPRLAWLAGAVGIGVVGALAFFRKSLGGRAGNCEPSTKVASNDN
jgi:transcriptional regulator with XRE-family HTH domain